MQIYGRGAQTSHKKLQAHLNMLLELLDIKIIMLIDDLDRCSIKKRYLLFQLINTIGKMNNIYFILAASPNELLKVNEPHLVSLVE